MTNLALRQAGLVGFQDDFGFLLDGIRRSFLLSSSFIFRRRDSFHEWGGRSFVAAIALADFFTLLRPKKQVLAIPLYFHHLYLVAETH